MNMLPASENKSRKLTFEFLPVAGEDYPRQRVIGAGHAAVRDELPFALPGIKRFMMEVAEDEARKNGVCRLDHQELPARLQTTLTLFEQFAHARQVMQYVNHAK